MIKCVNDFFTRHEIDLRNKKVVVGVSTGVDSMALLYALKKASLECEIIVAHVNHGKRQESKTEEEFIKAYCKKNGLTSRVLKLNENDFQGSNFQEQARILRQNFFKVCLQEFDTNILILGHHLNDDIETMLMRIIRGSNLKGYAGIDEYLEVDGMIIIRPFLKVLKTEIIDFVNKNDIVYFEDATNHYNVYTRNRIRNNVVPEIFLENETAHFKFIEFKKTIQDSVEVINHVRDKFINTKIIKVDKVIRFNTRDFFALHEFIQTEVMFELLKPFAFTKANILEIIKFIKSDKKNLVTTYKNVTFVKEYNNIKIYFYDLEKPEFSVKIDKIGEYNINEKYKIIVTKNFHNSITNFNKIWYNSNKLPIFARSRKPGDKISFDYGTKKVKKILIDKKIGLSDRNQTIILEKDKDILAVLGYSKSKLLKEITNCDIIIELKEKDNGNKPMH